MYSNQNLIKNTRNHRSGFFPDFPDPVFSRIFFLRGLAGGQTLGHFDRFATKLNDISPSVTWQKLADMKNAKNILFWGK